MTALCAGGGTSSARPGFDRFLSVAPYAVTGLLTELRPAAAAAIGAGIGNQFYDLSTFCVTDPPPMPTINALDVLALFNPVFTVAFNPSVEKFRALIANYAWNAFCQCDSGAQPARPTLPAPLLDFNPAPSTGPIPTTADGCFHQLVSGIDVLRDLAFVAGNGATPQGRLYALTPLYLTVPGATHTLAGGFTPAVQTYLVPSGATHVAMRGHTYTNTGGSSNAIFAGCLGWNAAGSQVGGFGGTNISPIADWALPSTGPAALSGAIEVFAWANITNGSPTQVIDAELLFYCGNTAPVSVQPCCPPDPTLSESIQRILSYVELIQRQCAPFGYVAGAVHSGLTGAGDLDVQGLLGMRVELTAIPPSVSQEFGDPERIGGAGWINWGNAEGWAARELLTSESFVSLPPLAGQYTAIGYSLRPGVEATITELEREP